MKLLQSCTIFCDFDPWLEQPKNRLELVLSVYEACEEMSQPGTEANEKLINAFYGTFNDLFGERR